MKGVWRFLPPALAFLAMCTASPICAQRTSGATQSSSSVAWNNALIVVRVRNPDGTSATRGITVTLESVEGATVNSCRTPSDGECTFVPPRPDIYVARIRQDGYQEVWGRIDLTITNHGYVSLELRPSDDAPPGDSKDASGTTVSAADLAVPGDARQEFEKGQKLLIDKDPGSSVPHFLKAIQIYAAFPQAYTMLGTAYLQLNNWKDAHPALEKAVQLDPKSAGAYLQLGAAYNQMKNYPEAEKALTRGLELTPNAAAGEYELAKTYWALGRWQDAEPHAAKAVEGMPDVAPVHVLMGNILLRKRDAQGALREFQEYLRLDPNGSMAPAVRDIVAKIQKALATQ